MPPAMINVPSPSMSVLKKYLTVNGYDVTIIYWNIKLLKLQQDFLWGNMSVGLVNELLSELIFYNYLAVRFKDREAYAKVKAALLALKPNYMTADPYLYDKHMKYYAQQLEDFINEELKTINFADILFVGMSVNLYQWICSSIIAQKIKEISPNTSIIVGGIGTKDSAISYLEEFKQFDIAIWGEGEYLLKQIADILAGKTNHSKLLQLAHIAYRASEGITASQGQEIEYVDLNDVKYYPEFDDFLELIPQQYDKSIVMLPIEGSRSCHWRKCHFCYLNSGYKHRLKSPTNISSYIRDLIKKHGIYKFGFMDNDIISNDWQRFHELLGDLNNIKNDYPKFEIDLAEIITQGINADIIRGMALAGFLNVQIGYESPSNNLLKKIEKKNTFASNLLFIKYACKYNIFVVGLNVIRGLLEETNVDIAEGIENLRFMRFFLGKIRHEMSNLGITQSSRYFKIPKNENYFDTNNVIQYLPAGFISNKSIQECKIAEKIAVHTKNIWDNFKNVEKFFIENSYTYQLYKTTDAIIYKEYFNGEQTNELEFSFDSLDYIILSNSNKAIFSYEQLTKIISNNTAYVNMTDCEVFNCLEELKKEGIIYCTEDYSEILTIIDLESIL